MDFGNSTINITNQPANTNQTEETTSNTGEKPVTIANICVSGINWLPRQRIRFVYFL